jgi:hypothetical protein
LFIVRDDGRRGIRSMRRASGELFIKRDGA